MTKILLVEDEPRIAAFVSRGLGLPDVLSVSRNPDAIAYLVRTVVGHWQAAGAPLAGAPA